MSFQLPDISQFETSGYLYNQGIERYTYYPGTNITYVEIERDWEPYRSNHWRIMVMFEGEYGRDGVDTTTNGSLEDARNEAQKLIDGVKTKKAQYELTSYEVGDRIQLKDAWGKNKESKQGEIVAIRGGMGGRGNPDPDPEYQIKLDDGYTFWFSNNGLSYDMSKIAKTSADLGGTYELTDDAIGDKGHRFTIKDINGDIATVDRDEWLDSFGDEYETTMYVPEIDAHSTKVAFDIGDYAIYNDDVHGEILVEIVSEPIGTSPTFEFKEVGKESWEGLSGWANGHDLGAI